MQLLGRENKQEQSKLALSSSLDRVIAVCARSLLPKQTAQTEQQQSSFLQKLFHPTRYQLERANRRETTDPLRNRLFFAERSAWMHQLMSVFQFTIANFFFQKRVSEA